MSNRVLASDIKEHEGKDITLMGWVSSTRKLGAMTFVILRDRSGTTQIKFADGADKFLEGFLDETVVEITGKVVRDERAPSGFEVQGSSGKIISGVKDESAVVISKKELNADLDTILEHRALTLRHPKQAAIFRVQSTILEAFSEYFSGQDFKEIKAPEITGVATEGGTEVFEVKYFDRKAYLVQSPQLYKQIMVGVFERVFTVARVFRAEQHNTSRHLNESTQMDIEMGFIKDHTDVLDMATGFLGLLRAKLEAKNLHDFELLGAQLPMVPHEVPTLRFSEVVEILKREKSIEVAGDDLTDADERAIGEYIKDKHSSDVLYVTHYPSSARTFYTYDDPDEEGVSRGIDIIFKGLEIASGGQRVHEYDKLVAKMKAKNVPIENFTGYLEAFKYGLPPEGGWSIGLERITMKLLNLQNIREASLFPRDRNRLTP